MIDEKERRKRRREFYIILVAFFIVGITFLEVHLRGAESPVGSNIIFFTILNVNLILLLLLLFLVIRNLVKLMLERRKGLLGSRLRTKLVMAFILLSLVPAMLLFFISALFITRSVESWFSAQVERSLQGALEVAQLYYRDLAADTVHWSRRIATSPPSTRKGWERRRAEYGLSWVGLFDTKGKLLQRASSKDLPEDLMPPQDLAEEILKGKEATKVTPFRSGEMVWGGYGKGDRAAVAGYYVPEGVLSKMQDISKAFLDYKRSQILKRPITLNYLLLLLTITLLIIFSAIWFGLRLAKEITVPVGRLVEGTRRVAEGDLD
ncbi:TPA: PAS domain-containing sensor histidine kinase, partial [Candidatus Bipolaricaulota bacterium]|nr:PAS domain-containing sensor histidine kinase [Candidatus Bipolaricaulota bacterium]